MYREFLKDHTHWAACARRDHVLLGAETKNKKNTTKQKRTKKEIKNRSAVGINSSSFIRQMIPMPKTHFLYQLSLSLNNFVCHFPSDCCVSQGAVWTPGRVCWLAALLGLCGQSIALIKGGPKHQLKSTGSSLMWSGYCEQFSHCIICVCKCASVSLWWVIEPQFSFTLSGRRAGRVTLDYCFPNMPGSMWRGLDSVNRDKSTEYDV